MLAGTRLIGRGRCIPCEHANDMISTGSSGHSHPCLPYAPEVETCYGIFVAEPTHLYKGEECRISPINSQDSAEVCRLHTFRYLYGRTVIISRERATQAF